MASVNFTITYDDGTKATVNPNRPRALLEFERQWGVSQPEEGGAHQNEQILWLCWAALGKPDGDFETWVDKVADFETPDAAEMMERLRSGNGSAPKATSRSSSRKSRPRAT